jgi:chromosome partitioning protein
VLKRQYAELIRQQCGQLGLPVAETAIREAVAIQEAQAMRTSLYTYAPKSNPARDYMKLIDELELF